MTPEWRALVAASENLKKSKCEEGKAFFRGLNVKERDHHGIKESLLLKGEWLRDALHQGQARRGRKAADCVFFLLRDDGMVQLVIVELKTGNDDAESFETQLRHAREDACRQAAACGLRLCEQVVFGAPRLPPSARGGRKGFRERWRDFEVAHEMSTLLEVVLHP